MARSDYLMRIVQQFSKALAALLSQSRSLNREPSFEELDELSASYAGFDLATLESLDLDQILQLYSLTGSLDVEKAYVVGAVLHELAKLEGDQRLERKALAMLRHVRDAYGEFVNEEHAARTEALEATLEGGTPEG